MPLVDAGYFIPGNAFVYTAAAGTAAPVSTALNAPPIAWTLVGHLGLDDGTGMPEFAYDGGEVTVKGSMSKKAIRTSVSKVVRSVNWSVSQFTRNVLGLYFGGTGGAVTDYFDVFAATDAVPTKTALLFTFNDGGNWIGWWAGQCATSSGDNLSTGDVENALLLPLTSTVLDATDPLATPRFRWIAESLLDLP